MGKASIAVMTVSVFVLAQSAPARAQERSVEVSGKLGYLSEWDVSATVVPHASGRRQEFSGPLTVRHTGICTTNGPVEMTGEIRYRLVNWLSRQIDATLVLDGAECGFTGKLGDAYEGVLSCAQWRGVPLKLSLKSAEPQKTVGGH
jgi:hypothetical protein